MNYRYIFLILLLVYAGAVFADCSGYVEEFDVRVLDAKYRPVEGAVITVTFDRGSSFGEVYFTTDPKTTDESGIVSYRISSQGTNTRTTDCDIVINASVGGATLSKTIVADAHGPTVDMQMTLVYPVEFYVRDQYAAAIENSTVSIADWGATETDSSGYAKLYLNAGNHTYSVSYMDAKEEGILSINGDSTKEVVFPHYPITIEVTDDYGEPLNVTLIIFNQQYQLEDGTFDYGETFGTEVPYELSYLGEVVSGTILPADEPDLKVRYDTHAPTISDVTSQSEGTRPKLSITVADSGMYASGVDVSSMEVMYSKGQPADEDWHSAVVFTTAKDTFAAEFPEMESNTIVNFVIKIKDQAGNLAELEGKFTTLVVEEPENQTGNNTGNPQNTQEEPQQEQGIPLLYIIGGVIILVLAVYLVNQIKSKAAGGV